MTPVLICVSATICAMVTSLPNFEHTKTRRMGMGREQEVKLQKDCEAMNSEGKIRDLLGELNRKAQELSTLRFEKYEDRNFYRIRQLKDDVHRITQKAKSILRPEWTESRWPYKATWRLRFDEALKVDPRVLPTNFAFTSFELDALGLGGIEREDLYPLVVMTTTSQEISVEIEKSASSLEMCQLQSTWSVEGTLKYKFQNQDFAQSVDLSIRPGVIQPPTADPVVETKPIVEPPKFQLWCPGLVECETLLPPPKPPIAWPSPIPWPSPLPWPNPKPQPVPWSHQGNSKGQP